MAANDADSATIRFFCPNCKKKLKSPADAAGRAYHCPRCGTPVTITARPDHYLLLQVTPNADPEVIEAAYKRLAFKYHPDRNHDPSAREVMQLLNDAHEVLCDGQKRIEYDAELRARKEARAERATRTSQANRSANPGSNSHHPPLAPLDASPHEPKLSSESPLLAQALGLHPIVAIFAIVLDFMLFGPESTVVLWFFCALPVSVGIVPICAIIQKRLYGDDWLVAIVKSIMVGILTAIPTPLPSVITGIAGIAGWRGLRSGCGKKEDLKRIAE